MDESLEWAADCLPEPRLYESREGLENAINQWARPRGYAFVTGRSTAEKTKRLTVTYICDRGRKAPDPGTKRKRQTTTKGTECPFSVLAKQQPNLKTWALVHRPNPQTSIHNHPPSLHPSAHPKHRTISLEAQKSLQDLTTARIQPKGIRTYLRQTSDTLTTQKDISNYIMKSRQDLLNGQSSIQALATQLDTEGFWSRIRFDSETKQVTAVLFAHPKSLAYLQAYPDLILLDCTYKTNKYGMPLLDIIGVDACNRSFCIAFAFLSGEKEADYRWVLERLRSVFENSQTRLPSVILTDRDLALRRAVTEEFPQAACLLCLWHANKAVIRYCQPTFLLQNLDPATAPKKQKDWDEFYALWHTIMASIDREAFDRHVQDLEKRFAQYYPAEVTYIKDTWLIPYKEALVKAWVDQDPHFGNTVTSRAEGTHALVKDYLQTSVLDLFETWRSIKAALDNQLIELQANQAKQQHRNPIWLSSPLFHSVRGWVSHQALQRLTNNVNALISL